MKRIPMRKKHIIFSKFKSLRTAMLVSFSVLIITALIIFSIIALKYTEDTVVKNSTDYTLQLITQVNSDIDSYIQYMKNISAVITSNTDTKYYLFNYQGVMDNAGTPLEDVEARIRVKEQFGTIIEARNDIYNIGILTNSGRCFINYGTSVLNPNIDLKSLDWYQETVAAAGSSVLSSSHVQTLIEGDYKWVVTISNMLTNPYTDTYDGLLFIDLNYNAIRDLCKNINLGSKGYVYIVDEDGQIVYHPRQQLLNSGIKTERIWDIMRLSEDKNYLITQEGTDSRLYTKCTSEHTGWTVVGVAYMDELMADKNQTTLLYFITAALLLFAALLFSLLLSNEITRPIKELQESMREVEKGNFETASISVSEANEIGSLSNTFNIMTREIQNLIEENVEEQRQKRSSELKALQAQINPHFLYNTLDSIIWMSETGKNKEVVLMTSSLAKLLRQSISSNEETVTIEKEVDYTKLYLTIQKMRYRNQLEFKIDVDEELLSIPIIKLVLQPLVENAIYHGIKYKEGIGTIYVSGYYAGEEIILEVADNGIGMSREQLSGPSLPKSTQKKSGGVGLCNIHNRLQLYYGKAYGITIESCEGEGTQVSIHLPRPKEENRI